ncbi:hypothetical protein MRY87_04115 [bacterium]|nr:hypothetical protein [bacterium]
MIALIRTFQGVVKRVGWRVCTVSFLLLPPPLLAQSRTSGSLIGLQQHEVLQQLGAPQEKEEREAKRESSWFYQDREIAFRNGEAYRDSAYPQWAPHSTTPATRSLKKLKKKPTAQWKEGWRGNMFADAASKTPETSDENTAPSPPSPPPIADENRIDPFGRLREAQELSPENTFTGAEVFEEIAKLRSQSSNPVAGGARRSPFERR